MDRKTTNDLGDIARRLLDSDRFVILTHRYPDGDTLGSAFALCRALRKLGKRSRVIVNGKLDRKFAYLTEELEEDDFEYSTVVAVDIASPELLGDLAGEFGDIVDISVDHHALNTCFAKLTYVDANAAANAENVLKLIKLLGVELDRHIAKAVYTGICTDTGCFRFSNVTSDTMRAAAELMDIGCDSFEINRVMFDTKSMARIRLEKAVLESLTFHADGRIAVINTTHQMELETGVGDADMDGISSIPRQIEGVAIGITIKERENGCYRISIRSLTGYDASRIGAQFGGGGHKAAAGCTLYGDIEGVKAKIVSAAEDELVRAERS